MGPLFCNPQKGEIGINIAGFYAGVVFLGSITKNGGFGKLEATAKTPFGQKASAGMGCGWDSNKISGSISAGATAWENVSGGVGIGGQLSADGAKGAIFSAAKAVELKSFAGLNGELSSASK